MWVRSALNNGSICEASGPLPGPCDPPGSTSATDGASPAAPPGRVAGSKIMHESTRRIGDAVLKVELQIVGIERDIEEVQEAVAAGRLYRGKEGDALVKEEERLVVKEQQLRAKEKQLRDENIALLRSNAPLKLPPNTVPEAQQQRLSFVMTSAFVDNPVGEKEEQRRLSQVSQLIKERRRSVSGYVVGDEAGTDTVANVYKLEEDSRLLVSLGAFEMPIVVSTLLAGFGLVLFDAADSELAQQLALLSFGLEASTSIVLCLISFRGQQLYSNATDLKPLTRKFLCRVCPVTAFALVEFAIGFATFVVSFIVEATSKLGTPWIAVIGVVLCPTVLAALLFVASALQVRRLSMPLPGLE